MDSMYPANETTPEMAPRSEPPWFERLAAYFPEHELKDPRQMQDLLSHHTAYRKIETPEYLVTYAEYPDFIFIDYLLVDAKTRGKGIGSKLLSWFKRKGKPIILEVEPPDADDKDTLRRIRFYEKNGFERADNIVYTRSDEDGETFTMNIYYWHPDLVSEQKVMFDMAKVCREIHNFRAMKYYGRLLADPEEVLDWDP